MTSKPLRLAMVTSLLSAALTPAVGLASAPILAHGLGPVGRGQVSAATTPYVLVASIAALGLSEALTYRLATDPYVLRRAIGLASVAGFFASCALIGLTAPLVDVLSGGDESLASIMFLSTTLALPMVWTAMLRGMASGLQMWYRVAIEKALSAIVRLGALLVLALTGTLSVFSAALTLTVVPAIMGLVYLPVLISSERSRPGPFSAVARPLLGYGFRAWFGAIAGILLAKLGIVLFTPLSNAEQLGLYVVGITISDVPLLLAFAVKDALFGVNSQNKDARQFAFVCRSSVLLAALGSLIIAMTLPLWIGVVFGDAFQAAVPSTMLQLASTVVNVPTFILAAGVGAWGRPGLRSTGLILTLVIDIVGFVLLVPAYGVLGATSANLVSATCGALFAVLSTSRVIKIPVRDLLLPRRSDWGAWRSGLKPSSRS